MQKGESWTPTKKLKIFEFIENYLKKNGNLLAGCQAAVKEFHINISVESVRQRFIRFRNNNGKERGNMLFNLIFEQGLVGFIEAWALANRPLSRALLLEHIHHLRRNGSNWNASGWFQRFLNRNRDRLSQRAMKGLTKEHIRPNLREDVEIFISFMDSLAIDEENNDFLIVNCDETRLSLSDEKTRKRKIDSKRRKKSNEISGTRGKFATFLPFHSPSGLLCSFFVLPLENSGEAQLMIHKASAVTRSSIPTYFGFTPSGYINSDIWLEIIKVFHREMQYSAPKKRIILFLDRLNIHLSNDSVSYCIDNNIDLVYFPVGSTHLLQPADNKLFASFKKAIRNEYHKRTTTMPRGRSIPLEITKIAQDMVSRITPAIVKSSWQDTGIYPYFPEKIRENIKLNFGEVDESEDPPIIQKVKKITQAMINAQLDHDSELVIRVTPEKNKLFSGRDLLSYQQQKRKKTSSTPKSMPNKNKNNSSLELDQDEDVQLVVNAVGKNIKCDCEEHNTAIRVENHNFEECTHCSEFQYCYLCYSTYTEGFILHESNCKKQTKKRSRR